VSISGWRWAIISSPKVSKPYESRTFSGQINTTKSSLTTDLVSDYYNTTSLITSIVIQKTTFKEQIITNQMG
jgi:hypothetical protein